MSVVIRESDMNFGEYEEDQVLIDKLNRIFKTGHTLMKASVKP